MTDVEVLDQSTPEDALEGYAATIRDAKRSGRDALGEVIESYFTIGHALIGARQEFGDEQSFNAWFTAQEFGLSRSWAYVLKNAAENDEAARRALSKQLADGTGPNIEKAVKEVTAPARAPRAPKAAAPAADSSRLETADAPAPEPEPVAVPEPAPVVDEATPSAQDPPFDAMRDALRADHDVHDDLVQIIIGIEDPYQAAETILAKYVLTPRTETTP
jgi:hypothetical protein